MAIIYGDGTDETLTGSEDIVGPAKFVSTHPAHPRRDQVGALIGIALASQ